MELCVLNVWRNVKMHCVPKQHLAFLSAKTLLNLTPHCRKGAVHDDGVRLTVASIQQREPL